MIRYVTIIALLYSGTVATAMPRRHRYVPPRKIPACEKILASEAVQAKVQDLAVMVAEVVGDLKLKLDLKTAEGSRLEFLASDAELERFGETLKSLTDRVAAIREGFKIGDDHVAPMIAELEAVAVRELAVIKAGLNLKAAAVVPTTRQPRRFMKRELFASGSPLEDYADWTADEIESYLSGRENSDTEPKRVSEPPPPTVDWSLFPGGPDWPPREKY